MKKLILISALLFSFNGWAYNETDLAKLKALNACVGCDLSGADLQRANLNNANLNNADLFLANLSEADLSEADLKNTDLTTTNLRYAKLDGAKYCKTKIRRKERNDDCENAD